VSSLPEDVVTKTSRQWWRAVAVSKSGWRAQFS